MSEPVAEPVAATAVDERPALWAVVLDDATRDLVERIALDLSLERYRVEKGDVRRAIDIFGAERSPHLLVVELGDADLPLSLMEELAEVCEPGTQVVAIGERNEVGLFRDLLRLGVADYLVKPVPPTILRESLQSLLEGRPQLRRNARLGRIVSIVGVRGGVGATMLACGLAYTISERRRRRVAVLDLDLTFGTVALTFDIDPSNALRDAFEDPDQVDSLYLERAGAACGETLRVFAAEEPLDGIALAGAVPQDTFASELRHRFHYTFLDLPRLPVDGLQRTLEISDQLLLVADFSLAAMRDTLRLLQLLANVNASCPPLVVVNRAGQARKGELERSEFEKGIGRKVDHLIPFDPAVPAAMNVGQLDFAKRGPVARALDQIADQLCGTQPAPRGWLARLWARLGR